MWTFFYGKYFTQRVDCGFRGGDVCLVGSTAVMEGGRDVDIGAFGRSNVRKSSLDGVVRSDRVNFNNSSERIRRKARNGS
jgi:hypothetical protein